MKLRPGLILGLSHWLVAVAVQVENLQFYALDPTVSTGYRISSTALLLVRQPENLLVSLAIGFTSSALWRNLPGKILATVFYLLLTFFVVFDQISYRLFFDHLNFSFSEGSLPQFGLIFDSARAEMDSLVIGNLVLAASLAVLPWLGVTATWTHSASRRSGVLLIGWIIAGFCLAPFLPADRLGKHPLPALLASSFHGSARTSTRPCDPRLMANRDESLRYGKANPLPDFSQIRKATQSRTRPPNVILIILESVGSLQFLKDGIPDPDIAPRISALAKNALIFEKVYNTFPATIRTHVPIETGGDTFTWGSVYDELNSKYTGPTLVGELKKRGYATALISAQNLTSENMNAFYSKLPFDYTLDPELQSEFPREAVALNSWGIRESAAVVPALRWAKSQAQAEKPFFIQFQTVASHHPYSVPPDFHPPFEATSPVHAYRNTIAYTDSVLGAWFGELDQLGLLDNTVIAIMGDHGEAFGDHHPRNLIHKNFLYEENIQNFLFLFDRHTVSSSIRSNQIAFVGDVAPTLLDFVGPGKSGQTNTSTSSGQSLISPDYVQKLRFFHKNSEPELWGVLDGQFKFIAPKVGAAHAELYDLSQDPFEHQNLAADVDQRVQEYDCLCRRWYMETNRRFASHLEGREHLATAPLSDTDTKSTGPKLIWFGTKSLKNGEFQPLQTIHPYEQVSAMTDWVPDFKEKRVLYEWISPSGQHEPTALQMSDDWTRTWVPYPGAIPLEEGDWLLKIWDETGKKELIQGRFKVDAKSNQSPVALSREPRSLRFETGTDETNEWVKKKDFVTGRNVQIQFDWKVPTITYRLRLELQNPKGEIETFSILARNPPVRISLPRQAPLTVGNWLLRLRMADGRKIGESPIKITP